MLKQRFKQIVSLEGDEMDLETEAKIAPNPEPVDGPFEQSNFSADAEITAEEELTSGQIILQMNEVASAIEGECTQSDMLLTSTQALEELVDVLIERIETPEGTLTPAEVIEVNTGVANIVPTTLIAEPALLTPSNEAFAHQPRLALETAAHSIVEALRKAWEYIVATVKRVCAHLRAFWAWAKKLVMLRIRGTKQQAEEITELQHAIKDHSEVEKLARAVPFTLRDSYMRDLWIVKERRVAKDIPHALNNLKRAYCAVQQSVYSAQIGWGQELLTGLTAISKEVTHPQSEVVARERMDAYVASYDGIVKGHESKVRSTATSYVGSYIGCIEIIASVSPFSVAKPQLPAQFIIGIPTLRELRDLNNANLELEIAYSSAFHEHEELAAGIEKDLGALDHLIRSHTGETPQEQTFQRHFERQTKKFIAAFNNAQGRSTIIVKRIGSVTGTVGIIVKHTIDMYKKHNHTPDLA